MKGHKFAIDISRSGFSCARVFAITIEDESYDIKYILTILNSKLIKFFLQHISPLKQGGFYTYSSSTLSQTPIKNISPEKQKPFINLSDKMLSLNKKLQEIGDKNTLEKQKLQEEIKKTDSEIDELVYQLYGITEEEKKIIEESLK